MHLFAVMFACSGPAPDDNDPDTSSSETATSTASTGSTADTGWTLPTGLIGTPPDKPEPPATEFEVLDADDVPRGPADVYAGVPTLLFLGWDLRDPVTIQILDDLEERRDQFESLGVRVLTVNRRDDTQRLREQRASDPFSFDLWTDSIGEEFVLYYGTDWNHFRLLRPDGYVLLEYLTAEQVNPSLAAQQILDDCTLIWGD